MLVGYYKGVDVIAAQYLVNLVEARLRTYGLRVRRHDVCDHETEHLVSVSLYRTADVAVGYYTYESTFMVHHYGKSKLAIADGDVGNALFRRDQNGHGKCFRTDRSKSCPSFD